MKKVKKIFSTLPVLILIAIFTSNCDKNDNVAPVADKETESAVDAAWATYVVTDIDQICGFMGENNFDAHFYVENTMVANSGTHTGIRDIDAEALIMGFNKTKCVDGISRDGSIFMYYKKDPISNPHANENSRYYREFGFVGRVSLAEYKVDGWLIKNFDNMPAYVYNRLTTALYDPRQVKLSWKIAGKFLMVHPTDPGKNIVWEGELIKTLENSGDKDIFAVDRQSEIKWVRTDLTPKKAAQVSYSGKVSGMTSATIPFQMTISDKTPLVRDFLCSSDVISGVISDAGSTAMKVGREEHHPFIRGIASFTTGTPAQNIYPRQIYFGNEWDTELGQQCDNEGVVQIKGNSYPVNFRK